MFEIYVNGSRFEMVESCSVAELINDLGLDQNQLAIELNSSILPRSDYALKQIMSGDKLEVVHAVGGG